MRQVSDSPSYLRPVECRELQGRFRVEPDFACTALRYCPVMASSQLGIGSSAGRGLGSRHNDRRSVDDWAERRHCSSAPVRLIVKTLPGEKSLLRLPCPKVASRHSLAQTRRSVAFGSCLEMLKRSFSYNFSYRKNRRAVYSACLFLSFV